MPWLVKRTCGVCGHDYRKLESPPLGDPVCGDCGDWLKDIEHVRNKPTSRYVPEPEHGGES